VLIFPFVVYAVALGGALSSTPEALKAAIFAVTALLSAEVAWRIILISKPHLKTN
jgi:hypothetical protein